MRYQQYFSNNELDQWLELEVSIGTNKANIEKYVHQLINLLKKFEDIEIQKLEDMASLAAGLLRQAFPEKLPAEIFKFLLIHRFIKKNNLLIISELIDRPIRDKDLEKEIFYDVAEDYFVRSVLPTNYHAYCAYRKVGSPTTWLYFQGDCGKEFIEGNVTDLLMKRICRYLTRKMKQSFVFKFSKKVGNKILFIIAKDSNAVVIRRQKSNKEIQKAVYSFIVLDLDDKRLGIVSRSKAEIAYVHRYLKIIAFKDKLFSLRTDHECNPSELLKKLLFLGEEEPSFDIHKLEVKRTSMEKSPQLRLVGVDGEPINAAINSLRSSFEGLGINDLRCVEYKIKNNRVPVYAYGSDEWKRKFLNIATRGRQYKHEADIISELQRVFGVNIKETRFVIEKLAVEKVVEKILRDAKVMIEPAIPEYVEKIITVLVSKKLIKKPSRRVNRICERFECSTKSWEEWNCPKCGHNMIIVGEEITINIDELAISRVLTKYLVEEFNAKICRRDRRRGNIAKKVIEIQLEEVKIPIYIVVLLEPKDIRFVKHLNNEGRGIIAICHPQLKSREQELKALNCGQLDLSFVIAELRSYLLNEKCRLKESLTESLKDEKKKILERIFSRLRYSERQLREIPPVYNDNLFEIDVKNILQALVPNVVRLGQEYSGSSVPDGYCSYPAPRFSTRKIFGWDAKYSETRNYKLKRSDIKKQLDYITWLCDTREVKATGKLSIYSIISNFDDIRTLKSVLSKISKSSRKPLSCRLMLVQDKILQKLAEWICSNWRVVLDSGPDIHKVFFSWIRSTSRQKCGRWYYCTIDDWPDLEKHLLNITS